MILYFISLKAFSNTVLLVCYFDSGMCQYYVVYIFIQRKSASIKDLVLQISRQIREAMSY